MNWDDISDGVSFIFELLLATAGIIFTIIMWLIALGFFGPGFILGIFFAILAGCWVYKDARKRESRHAYAWAISTAALLIIFLPMYLVFRPDMPEKKSKAVETYSVELCPHCGKYYRKPAKFCPSCGADLSAKESLKRD